MTLLYQHVSIKTTKSTNMLLYVFRYSQHGSIFRVSVFYHLDPCDPVQISNMASLRHRRVIPDTDHEPYGARGCRVTDDRGCIPLSASHSISGLLSSTLLCLCHMYANQRHREVGCPVCHEASVTFMAWMHRNEDTHSGSEWTLIFEWRQE